MAEANPILTAEWLRQRHHDEGMRVADMARAAGCSTSAIRRSMDRHGIFRRDDRSGAVHTARRASFDLALARRLYEDEQMACDDIGLKLGVHGSTVRRRLVENDVRIRHHNDTKRGKPSRNRIALDAAEVVGLYLKPDASMKSVGDALGVSQQVVARVLAEAGVPSKPPEAARYVGSRNPNWRPDLTPEEREKRRDMAQQAKWRTRVYERDSFTCQCCLSNQGRNLNAHHVRDHATNPDERWSLDNGVTLCAPCHRGFHSAYGLTGVDRDMLEQFIADRSAPQAA